MLQKIVSVKKRIPIIGSEWVSKQSYDLANHSERLFQPELSSQGSINMEKLLLPRFQKRFGLFTMLLVEGSSETSLFRRLTNNVLGSP